MLNPQNPPSDASCDREQANEACNRLTALEAALKARAEAEERLALAVHGLGDGLWDWNLADGRVWRSEGALAMLGRHSGEMPDTADAFDALIHPDDLPQVEAALAAHLAGDTPEFACDCRVRGHDGQWIWIYDRGRVVARDAEGRPLRMVGVYRAIGARKADEMRRTFLLQLNEELRRLSDPVELMDTACRLLGRHLGVAQLGFAEMEADDIHAVVHRDWSDGRVVSAVGRWNLESLGLPYLAELRAGQTVPIADVTTDPRTEADEAQAAYKGIGVRSILDVPLVKGGRLVALMFVHHAEPRSWSDAEIATVEDVCERLWAAVERERAEARLRTSDERLRLALESTQAGLWDWNLVTGDMGWDARTFRLFAGMPGPDVIDADTFLSRLDPDDRGPTAAAIARAMDPAGDGRYEAIFRAPDADGAQRWFVASGQCEFADGRPVRFVGLVRDFTQMRAMTAALDRDEARLKLAQEAAGFGTWELELPGGDLILSPASLAMHGLDPGHEPRLTAEEWSARVDPEDGAVGIKAAQRAFATGELYDHQFRALQPDGGIRWIHGMGRAEYDAEGRAVRMIGINVDVTARRRAEEDLRRAQEGLLRASRLSAMGSMASTLAHELNQPLAAITNSAAAARRRMKRLELEDQPLAEVIAAVESDALRAGALVKRMRELSPSGEVRAASTSLRQMLADAWASLSAVPGWDEARLEVDVAPTAGRLHVDRVQIEQVLSHLLRNALEAMAGREQPWIAVQARRQGGMVEIRVADGGPGLELAEGGQPFQLFHPSSEQGRGLGLALCRTMVEAHGGRISAGRAEGGGAELVLTLPAGEAG